MKNSFFPERFNAEDITTIGENLYEIKLTIDPVTEVRIAEMLLIKCILSSPVPNPEPPRPSPNPVKSNPNPKSQDWG